MAIQHMMSSEWVPVVRDEATAQVLEQKVREGGSGVWGDIPTPPNPAVPDAELHAIVQWVLTSRSNRQG